MANAYIDGVEIKNATYDLYDKRLGSIGQKNSLTVSDISDFPSIPSSNPNMNAATGTLAISHGGTGATNAAAARTNLELGDAATKSSTAILNELTSTQVTTALGYTPPQQDTTYLPSMTGTLGISQGGTGNTNGYIQTGRKSGTTLANYTTIEGVNNTGSGQYSHAEGYNNSVLAKYAHVEGYYSQAGTNANQGLASHAEGSETLASGDCSHAEGLKTTASMDSSHAEGVRTTASGDGSHAEGYETTASGMYSHSSGYRTTAGYDNQLVCGKYNVNRSTTLVEVGNGTSTNNKHNAFEVYGDGSCHVSADGDQFVAYSTDGTKNLHMSVDTNGNRGLWDAGLNNWLINVNQNNGVYIAKGIVGINTNTGDFIPMTDNKSELGGGSFRWKQIYAANPTIITSDKNQKRDIEPIDETLEQIFLETPTYTYYFKDGDRRHIGTVSQDIEELIAKHNVTPEEFAPFCKDHITEKYEEIEDENGIKTYEKVEIPEEEQYDTYSFRYEEYIMLTVHMVQKLYNQVDELKNKNLELENRIIELENRINNS